MIREYLFHQSVRAPKLNGGDAAPAGNCQQSKCRIADDGDVRGRKAGEDRTARGTGDECRAAIQPPAPQRRLAVELRAAGGQLIDKRGDRRFARLR